MANLLKYKRFMCIGCSHGSLINPKNFEIVQKFKRQFKPHTRIHLGDICDYAAFRSGAPGTSDEAVALGPDIAAGVKVIREYTPTHILIGNHDERVWRLANHPNAVIAMAAGASRNEFLTACQKAKVTQLVDHYDINRSWLTLGDTKFAHGWMYGENALRDHAEHFGKIVIAHLHQPGAVRGRRSDRAVAYCVGTLADIPMMEYAKTRRSTARWGAGLVYGEYSDTDCRIHLSQAQPNGAWILP